MEEQILEIFKVVLKQSEIDKDSLIFGETRGWNSLGHMEIIFMLEEEFEVEFTSDDIAEMRNFAEVCQKVKGKLG